MVIDFEKTPKIIVKFIKENNEIIKIAYHNETVDFKTVLNDLVFEDLKENLKDNIILSNGYNYSTLMIELKPDSEIGFFDTEDNNNNNDNDNNLGLILAIAIPVGIILILIIIFLVCRYCKRNNEIDTNENEAKDKEMLMPQGE